MLATRTGRLARVVGLALALTVAAACGDIDTVDCVSERVEVCACGQGVTGTRVCQSDNTWSECTCSADAGVDVDAGTDLGDAGDDLADGGGDLADGGGDLAGDAPSDLRDESDAPADDAGDAELDVDPDAPAGHLVSFTVVGLAVDRSLEARLLDANSVIVNGDGEYTFARPLIDGTPWDVTVSPVEGDDQLCFVAPDRGIMGAVDIDFVMVRCVDAVAGPPDARSLGWNDYRSEGLGPLMVQAGGNCDSDDRCVHVGEVRAASIPGVSSCATIDARDELGAFDWACGRVDSQIWVFTTELRDDRRLADLIDDGIPGWRTNTVAIYQDGRPIARTPSVPWWPNHIEHAIPDAPGDPMDLSDPGTIYLLGSTPSDVTVNADRIGVVVREGEVAEPGSEGTQVSVPDVQNAWIEGDFVNDNASGSVIFAEEGGRHRFRQIAVTATDPETTLDAVYLDSVSDALVDQLVISGGSHALLVDGSPGALVSDVIANNTTAAAVDIRNSRGVRLSNLSVRRGSRGLNCLNSDDLIAERVRLSDVTSNGIELEDCFDANLFEVGVHRSGAIGIVVINSRVRLVGVAVSNGRDEGILLNAGAGGSELRDVLSFANNDAGIRVEAQDVVLMNVTSAHNGTAGISLSGADGFLLMNALVFAQTDSDVGVSLFESDGTIVNLALANNDVDISHFDSTTLFSGLLSTDPSPSCTGSGIGTPGVDETCTVLNGGGMNTTVPSLDGELVGAIGLDTDVPFDDRRSFDDTLGVANGEAINDFGLLESALRVWATDVPSHDVLDSGIGGCVGDTTCRIYDLHLRTTAHLADRTGSGLPQTNFDVSNVLSHTWADDTTVFFQDGAMADVSSLEELAAYPASRGSLLCDASEDCIRTPNFGADQGEGHLIDSGVMRDGGASLHTFSNTFQIAELQDPRGGARPPEYTYVEITEAVVTAVGGGGFWVQDIDGGPWSGIFVFLFSDAPTTDDGTPVAPGQQLTIAAKFAEFRRYDELLHPTSIVLDREDGPLPEPHRIRARDLRSRSPWGEPYSNLLVEVSEVYTRRFLDPPPTSAGHADDFFVSSEPAALCAGPEPPCARVTDFIYDGGDRDNDQPATTVGEDFAAIVGIVFAELDEYRLAPRSDSDLVR